jgi:hypothetical protein
MHLSSCGANGIHPRVSAPPLVLLTSTHATTHLVQRLERHVFLIIITAAITHLLLLPLDVSDVAD